MAPDPKVLRLLTRSISLPVQASLSCPWPEFARLLRACWRHSTDLANWASHALCRLDVVRTPGIWRRPAQAAAPRRLPVGPR